MSRILRLPEVIRKTGLSKSTIYLRIKKDDSFPKPIQLGSCKTVGFLEGELDDWIHDQAQKRQGEVKL